MFTMLPRFMAIRLHFEFWEQPFFPPICTGFGAGDRRGGHRATVCDYVRATPTVLAYLPETLQRRVQFLAENRLDVVRHIDGFPQVLICSVGCDRAFSSPS